MTTKLTGYYTDALDNGSGRFRLVMEISGLVTCAAILDEVVCGIELFSVEDDWETALADMKRSSKLLQKQYEEVTCFHHPGQVLVIPVKQFDTVAAADYLSLVFGEHYQHDVRHDVLAKKGQVTAYLLDKTIHDALGKHFVLYKPRHVYTALLDSLLTREQLPSYLIHLQVYEDRFILVLLKEGNLQLVRTFQYKSAVDIQYFLISTLQQFPVVHTHASLEISGRIEEGFLDMTRLKKLFSEVTYLQAPQQPITAQLSDRPGHYFTPLFNMAI